MFLDRLCSRKWLQSQRKSDVNRPRKSLLRQAFPIYNTPMSVIVSIALATICFTYQGAEECHPILLGKSNPTPKGEYFLQQRLTDDPGYGGDVLQFHETREEVYAIHRVWLLKPEQKRMERLRSKNVKDRYISAGCINVDPVIYDKLIECCSTSKLIIKEINMWNIGDSTYEKTCPYSWHKLCRHK